MKDKQDRMAKQLEGKVVMVTGAGRGLGRAVALAFGRQGAVLAVNDLTPINLDETVSQIKTLGAKVKDYVFDVARKMPAEELVSEVLDDWGRIDILINHVTVHPHRNLLDMDEWDFRRTLDVNLSAAFFMTQLVGRVMKSQSGGDIVYLAADLDAISIQQESTVFWISQMGLIGLTLAAAKELAPYNVRVNTVIITGTGQHAIIETPIINSERLFPDGQIFTNDPLMGTAEQILFMCSQGDRQLSGRIFKF